MSVLEKVQELETLLLEDAVPCIEAVSPEVVYQMGSLENPLNYADRRAFLSEFGDETGAIAELSRLLLEGQNYIHLLYSFRSCARALPMVTDPKQADKEEVYSKTFEVLLPEITKLKALMEFHEAVIKTFCKNIQKLVTPDRKRKVVPEELYCALINSVDLLLVLDSLKDTKASLQNDFSFYKRAFEHVKDKVEDSESHAEDNHNLQMFLGNPQHPKSLIFHNLKTAVRRISGHEDVLIELMKLCVERLESKNYLLPNEKYRFIRVLPHILLLLDGPEGKDGFNIFKSKRVKIDPIRAIFKKFPVVPVYGDISMKPVLILRRAPHFNYDTMAHQWGSEPDIRAKKTYDLPSYWKTIRSQYESYSPRLVHLVNEVRAVQASAESQVSREMAKRTFDVVLEGVQLLCQWKTRVLDQAAWKYQHPASLQAVQEQGANVDAPGVEYERVVRFNYSAEEQAVLIDVIAAIKGLGNLLHRLQPVVSSAIRLSVHAEVQVFIQDTLRTLLHRADKKKRPVKQTLLQLRAMAADWMDGQDAGDNYKAKKAEREQSRAVFPRRHVAPSPTQLHFIRAITRALYDDRSVGMSSGSMFFSKKDFDGGEIAMLKGFYERSFYYSYLLDLPTSLREATELSDLWYREFYLEMTKCVQFQIDMSMPWVLVSHLMSKVSNGSSSSTSSNGGSGGSGGSGVGNSSSSASPAGDGSPSSSNSNSTSNNGGSSGGGGASGGGDGTGGGSGVSSSGGPSSASSSVTASSFALSSSSLMENLLFVMDIYNDAAYKALHSLRQQFLYDEIEAEVNLAFDQLSFLLSDEIYSYYKNVSSSMALDRPYKEKIEALRGVPFLTMIRRRYEVLLPQKHVQVLSRSIDLSALIAQHLRAKLAQDVEAALQKFEASDLTGIIEFEKVMEIIRETHVSLSKFFHMEDFEEILMEANESVSPTSFHGRLVMAVLAKLVTDLFPNFSYRSVSSAFVRSPLQTVESNAKEVMPRGLAENLLFGSKCSKAYEVMHKVTRASFGAQHVSSLVRVLGPSNLPLIVDECLNLMEEKIKYILSPYFSSLSGALPPCKMPKFMYKSGGCYAFFEGKLKDLLQFEDLKPKVFQTCREMGNILAFLYELDMAQRETDCLMKVAIKPFFQSVFDKESDSSNPLFSHHISQFSSIQSTAIKEKEKELAQLGGPAPKISDEGNSATDTSEALKDNLSRMSWTLKSLNDSALDIEQIYSNYLNFGNRVMCIVPSALERLQTVLIKNGFVQEWNGSRNASTEMSETKAEQNVSPNKNVNGPSSIRPHIEDVENTEEFYRLWSAMQFLYCVEVENETDDASSVGEAFSKYPKQSLESGGMKINGYTDEDIFGDGMLWTGCALVYLLGQKERFELFDYCNYVLKVDRYDRNSDKSEIPKKFLEEIGEASGSSGFAIDSTIENRCKKFMERAQRVMDRNFEIFSILNTAGNLVMGSKLKPDSIPYLSHAGGGMGVVDMDFERFNPPGDDESLPVEAPLPKHTMSIGDMKAALAEEQANLPEETRGAENAGAFQGLSTLYSMAADKLRPSSLKTSVEGTPTKSGEKKEKDKDWKTMVNEERERRASLRFFQPPEAPIRPPPPPPPPAQ